jgi:membrane protease YdiL (CAAX protease family)
VALAQSRGQFIRKMDQVTVISMHASYGFAAILFLGAAALRMISRAKNPGLPPALPVGKVSDWFYKRVDLIVVGMIVGFYYLPVIFATIAPEEGKGREITAPDLIFNMGLQCFLVALVTAMVIGRIRPVAWLGLNWKQWPRVFFIAPVTVLTMWVAFAFLYAAGYETLMESLGVQMVQDTVDLFQTTRDMDVLIMMAFTAVIIAPLCEEVVFRGYLYPALKRFSGPWMGAVVSALFFSAAHGSVATLAPLFIFGLALVFLYEWTGSIWAPVSAHFLFNAATVGMQLLVRFGYIPEHMLQ